MSKKPFLCKLGFHKWYLDMAYINSVNRCTNCDAVQDKSDAREVDKERRIWKEEGENPNNTDFFSTYVSVAKRLNPELYNKLTE